MHTPRELTDQIEDRPVAGPLAAVGAAWVVGILVAAAGDAAWWWCGAAGTFAVATGMALRHFDRAARCWALVAIMLLGAAWYATQQRRIADDDIRRWLVSPAQLAEVTGVVASEPYVADAQRGAFGRFTFRDPGIVAMLDVEAIVVSDNRRSASGRLLLKIETLDGSLRVGDRVRATGWLAPIDPPQNPGEFDFRAMLAERGVYGRLTLPSAGNYERIDRAHRLSIWLARWRGELGNRAARSLRIGMSDQPQRLALLDALLLGRRDNDLEGLDESFRRVGLAHLLSISGAHLGILLWVVWGVARALTSRPSRAMALVMAVLLLYLLAVPPRVPIIRAGIMAAVFCFTQATGREMRRLDLLALAAIIVLIWRPGDLFTAGFQLSFGAVMGLMLFVRPVSEWLFPAPAVLPRFDLRTYFVKRFAADYLAVNIVAFAVSMPLIMHHFQAVTPYTVVLSVLALPVITATLALGYIKLLVGFLLPSAGLLLAGPLQWITDATASLVEHAATWPGASIQLSVAPSVGWTAGALMITFAVLGGWFARRKVALAAAIALCAAWLIVPTIRRDTPPPMRVNMFMVGNGSCFLVRLHDHDDDYTIMFDCGSQQYWDVGVKSIAPALSQLDVDRIDLLIVSHADIDHYCGVLDVIDRVPVATALINPQLRAEAAARPNSAVAFLVDGMRDRGVVVQTVSRGWSFAAGGATLDMLWPPADFDPLRANDTSLVLSVRQGEARVLLNGDIQADAIARLLASHVDLRADVADLPHHGSFVDNAPAWLGRVQPRIALQSSGAARLRDDPWPVHLDAVGAQRWITEHCGMVQIDIDAAGAIDVRAFADDRALR